MKQFSDYGIEVAGTTGEVKALCPQCSAKRRKTGVKCLNVNLEKGVWHCWHCDWSGGLSTGVLQQVAQVRRKVYSKPKPAPASVELFWRQWLNKRNIGDNTIDENRLSSCMVYMPQVEKEVSVICFNYYRDGEIVNCKYRDKDKNFRMYAGAERVLYGLNDVQEESLVWVEGEMDKLSVYEAGFVSCVSVPDGAPSVETKNYSSKFEYLESAEAIISGVKKHIIAVDGDKPGEKLKEELIRRLGAEKCRVVRWPEGCKDANEVLTKHGRETLKDLIETAKAAPVEGVFYVDDIEADLLNCYENGEVGGLKAGWNQRFDSLYSVRPGDFTVVTGIPGHGKSEFIDALLINLIKRHHQRYAVCSPENQPLYLHLKKFIEKWTGLPFFEKFGDRMGKHEVLSACGGLQHHISFILPEQPTLDCILNRASIEVYRRGINGLVIDPWNELEHARPAKMSESEYIGDALRRCRQFARQKNIHLWVIAHPTKLQELRDKNGEPTGQYKVPTPYDICGSANWRNKADNCIAVYRKEESVDVHIQKIRVKEVGRVGVATFGYSITTGKYSEKHFQG